MIRHIPNLLTLSNLFCGCCALLCVLGDNIETAAWFTVGSFVFDYLDGMTARALKVSSPLGKELDSLADMVSFGVVPGAIFYRLLFYASDHAVTELLNPVALPGFVLSMFAAYRLGKFNLDTRQTTYFLGLSTPACTVFVLGLGLACAQNLFGINAWLLQPILLYVLIAALSALMVSEIPMFGMKIKRFDLQSNLLNLGFLLLFVVLVWWLKVLALPVLILIYIGVSIAFKNKVIA